MDCRNCILKPLLVGLFVLVLANSADAADRFVPDNYSTIQEAVDAADPGDTINVMSGTYYENVVVNKALTLQGWDSGNGTPVVDAQGSGDAITLSKDGCTLKGFVVRNSGSTQSGIRVASKGNTISENTVTDNSYGIFLIPSTRDNSITNNNAKNNAYGIYLSSSTSINTINSNEVNNNDFAICLYSCHDNTISDNTVTDNSYGIYLVSSNRNKIIDNKKVFGNTNHGISLLDSSDGNTISGNTAEDNKKDGIYLDHSDGNIISGNTAKGNGYNGIRLEYSSDNDVISKNTANGNSYSGISLFDSSHNTISGNFANNNDGAGIVLGFWSEDNTISGNTANGNKIDGIYLDTSSNNIISANTAEDNIAEGICLFISHKNKISGNIVKGNKEDGILLKSSDGNTIFGNTANDNTESGIHLDHSSRNFILVNIAATGVKHGIHLTSSNMNPFIVGNIVKDIFIDPSSGNIIFLNTLDSGWSDGTNFWNSTTEIAYGNATTYVGNIWSGYAGFDCDGDGIGDTPYPIPGGSDIDYHPIGGVLCSPGLEAEKISNRSEAKVGDWINYTVQVNNTGNVNLTGVRMEDNLTGAVWNVGTLVPGQNYTNTTSYQVNLSDLPGPLINMLQANGTDPCGGYVTDSAIETVNIISHGLLCISGYKIDQCTGDGLPDWEIILNNSSGEVARNLTNDTGYYEFCELEPGDYNLSETLKPGWEADYAPETVTLDCDNVTCQNFTNHEPLCIKGAKFDNCTGEGLANWTMKLKNSTGSVINSTVTDTEGKYSFCGLDPGNYTVSEILKDGYISAGKTSIDVELKCENSEDNDFKNIKLLCINGTKTNALTGDPLGGCYINLTAENGTVVGFTTTEADGRFSFCGLEPGNYTICEFIPGSWKNVTDRCIYVELECEDLVINFQNVPTALCINGSKTSNCTGEALANWTIELRDEAGDLIDSKKTDASGDYSFCNLEAGNYTVCELLQEGWKNVTPSCIPVTLDTDSSENNDFANDPPVCINGSKINDCTEEGIAGWKITLYDIAGNKIGENVTDANGRYSFCGLMPGRRYWVCEEIKDGWEPVKDEKESVPPFICPTCKIYCKCVDLTCEGAEIDLRNVQRSLCINGTKINNCTGEGLAGWTIYLYNVSGIKIKTTQTDRNGHYSFCGLAPGVYRVCEEIREGYIPVTDINHSNSSEICAPGECENCIPVILDCDNSDGNDFENIPPLSIVGRMIDDCTGLGMANEVVKLYDAQGVMKSTARTNATGYYVFNSGASLKLTSGSLYTVCEVVQQNWTPVTYHANTSHPASNEYCIPVFLDCGETEVEDFENIPSLCISGHEFNHCTGEGLDNWVIHLTDNAGNVLSTTTTDDTGYYEFCSLESGWYTVCEDSIPDGWTSFRDAPNSPAMTLPGTSAAPEDCERPKCIVVNLDYCLDSTDNDFENIPEFCIKGIVYNNSSTTNEVMKDFPVKIENSDGSLRETVSTDDSGEYSLCGLKAGTYTVCVAKIGWTADEPCAIVYLDCEDMDQNFDVYKGRNTLVPGITQPAITLDGSRGAVVPGAISVEPGQIGDEAGDMGIEPASREILNPQMT